LFSMSVILPKFSPVGDWILATMLSWLVFAVRP
jgi:hypothetical protein